MMENKIPLTTIVIRTFNEIKHIKNLLKLCFSQKTSFDYEVIVVDSGSTDGTLEVLKDFNVKLVHIKSEDFTFGRSLNYGIKEASGDYCVIVSAHCYPSTELWLENIIKPFHKDNVAMVYGKQRGDERSKYSELQIFYKWFPEDSMEQTNFAFCNNANSAIRRKFWSEYPFDESLTGLEDLDWAQVMISKNRIIAYEASSCVLHIHEETYKQIQHRYFREALAYKNIYKEQKFTLYNFIQFLILNIISDLLHAIKERKIFSKFVEIILFRYNQFYGTYKAHQYTKPISKEMKRRLYYPRNPKHLLTNNKVSSQEILEHE